ncbi:MAG: MFS transporter [Corynebacterium provencense]|uniref:MFS transporter n=1 Tax=Corynebacterium provencense TaxID=1737425 RepID=UPI002989A821|nr:MFS transporter [Corynebacterium provencense]
MPRTTPRRFARTTPGHGMRTFVHILVNTAVANLATSFLWFGLTFWIYAETRNVIASGAVGAAYMLFVSACSMLFGTLVDRFDKKAVMVWATVFALGMFLIDLAFFAVAGADRLSDITQLWFWLFTAIMLAGAVVEQLRGIALSTTVTLLVPEERRANANGMVGTVQGLSMLVTSIFSGLSVGYLGMGWTMVIGTGILVPVLLHLASLTIREDATEDATEDAAEGVADADSAASPTGLVDLRGGWAAVLAVPGLLALILFTTLNNLFGGLTMTLMDPYGIELFGVQGWGIGFAVAATGLFVGGGLVAAKGLGRNPVRTMLLCAAAVGVVGALFTIRDAGWLFLLGSWLMMALIPAVEAAEQTVIQQVVPYRKQGRVFGFANTFEAATAPVVGLLVAPLAELWVIPYMETDAGRDAWSWLVGTGESRGIALVFVAGGVLCVLLSLAALCTPQYRLLRTEVTGGESGTARGVIAAGR